MKGDFSRQTFIKERHYSGVLLQQGRVLVDADWNELQAIQHYRIETEAGDVIGPCGAPESSPGFQITGKDRTVVIGPGHYYVDGILCECEQQALYEKQPDLLDPPALDGILKDPGAIGLVYLDVWRRHITRLDDPNTHEKALGDPDTATRAKTVWQVRVAPIKQKIANPASLLGKKNELQAKLHLELSPSELSKIIAALAEITLEIDKALGGLNCDRQFPEWGDLTAPSTGMLNARTQPALTPREPCGIMAGAGYRRLENQLYRVEIHQGGDSAEKKKVTFKWSRENGSIVTAWEDQSGPNHEFLTVASPGRDTVLGFASGQWVELTDDKRDLDGTPGTLVRLLKVDGQTLTVDPATVIPAGASILLKDFPRNPKVRRWDSPDGVVQVDSPTTNDGWHELEAGIQVQFSQGTYHTGDYWLIPARTDGAEIEWPPYKIPNKNPLAQPPLGIQHHYCPLALIFRDDKDKKNIQVFSDCRRIFPPLTGLINFYYVGGDGQEAMPDLTLPKELVALAKPLEVGVANWRWPVAGATVLFEIPAGQGLGLLEDTGTAVKIQTDVNGIASCTWKLDPATQDQQVQATLLDDKGRPMQVPIRFHANLSVASQVAYNPKACSNLKEKKNVQDAIDQLADLSTLVYIGGDGQVALPDPDQKPPFFRVEKLLQVAVVNDCGPVEGALVVFEAEGDGLVAETLDDLLTAAKNSVKQNSVKVKTKKSPTGQLGVATCAWKLDPDPKKPTQQVVATLEDAAGHQMTGPTQICFTAHLSLARHVAFEPPEDCRDLSKSRDVQRALEILCERPAGAGCSVTVPLGKDLNEVINELREKHRDICICLMPGDHDLKKGLAIEGTELTVKISGCGPGTRIKTNGPWIIAGLTSFSLNAVQIQVAEVQEFMDFRGCAAVSLESCFLEHTGLSQKGFLCKISEADRIHLARNSFRAILVQEDKVQPDLIFKDLDEGMAKLFTIREPRRFSRQASPVVERLAALNLRERQALTKNLKTKLTQYKDRLTEAESNAYNDLAAAFAAPTIDKAVLAGKFNLLADAVNQGVTGLALSLSSPDAATFLVENLIAGEVSLYGGPSAENLTLDQLKSNAGKIHEILSKPSSSGSRGFLHLRNNQLTLLTSGEWNFQAILGKNDLGRVYRAAFLTDNLIETQKSLYTAVVAEQLTLAGNSYAGSGKIFAGIMVARCATFTGNHGLDKDIVMEEISLFQDNNKAANAGITINKW